MPLSKEKLIEKLNETAYVLSADNNKAVVDFITDTKIYTGGRNKALSNGERLMFDIDTVLEQINNGNRNLISDKIEVDLDALIIRVETKLQAKLSIPGKREYTAPDYSYEGIKIGDKVNLQRARNTTVLGKTEDLIFISLEGRDLNSAYNDVIVMTRPNFHSELVADEIKVIELEDLIEQEYGIKLKDVLFVNED